ncbi:21 kDa protein-like [Panicum miliaceum]|uniref:21 kDa protein-like n=1 Tax=Panicum miliaceum TaxID=4540 RepID=A0A3L6TRY1_PANMI|nr:21 kDa protein-like [Panicum miliaceum]
MLLVVAFLLAAAATWQPAASALPPAPAPEPAGHGGAGAAAEKAGVAFVRSCCARTLYPRLCRAGLVPHAASVHSSHARLALASANLTLAALGTLAARIPPPGPGALGDCAEAVASAADQAARAAERLRGVEQAVGPEVLWRVDDALTWLSAAMTDEDTCADGLWPRKYAPAPVRAELRARVRRAKQYTSIALALVRMLASSNPRS